MQQQNEAKEHSKTFANLAAENHRLQQQLNSVVEQSAEIRERQLQQIGSDLHNGAAQYLAVALLRLHKLFGAKKGERKEYEFVKGALTEAMAEIRHISMGLTLPEIEKFTLSQAIGLVITRHERRTSTSVKSSVQWDYPEPPKSIKICACRMVQEALSNAFKHAGGLGQKVSVSGSDATLFLKVSDTGNGFDWHLEGSQSPGFGLAGLRNRIESTGGKFEVISSPGNGTILKAILPIESRTA